MRPHAYVDGADDAAACWATGKMHVKIAPPWARFSPQILPPRAFTMDRLIERPIPRPSELIAAKLTSSARIPVQTPQGERTLREVTGESLADACANPLVQRTDQLWHEAWAGVQDAKRAVSTITGPNGEEHIRGRDLSVLAPIINAAAQPGAVRKIFRPTFRRRPTKQYASSGPAGRCRAAADAGGRRSDD